MVDFKGLEGLYDDINQVGSRPVGLMTEFKTESGRPIYISHNGEIVSEKSTTIPYNGKYVNVPSIHDGIEYSEFELRKLLDEKQIKPTSTHKTQELAVKAAQKRSPSLMAEETARAVESKYWKEMTKRKATADQILGDSSTELVTPDAKANIQMRNLELINEDDFLGLADPSEKTDKLDAYMSTLSEQDKLNIQKTLKKPKARINSIEGDESMAKGRARRNLEDQTVSAFAEGGMEDGGLKDEGGTVDPVSGNDVPAGSTQKEVRDDIPAQLSEGEFVFPADVTRYIGLENLMELRNKAKKGLAQMDAMGQMGNSEEATMDDTEDMDVDIDAMIDEFDPNSPETMQFALGGVVKAQAGAVIPGQMPPQQFSYGYQPPQQQTGYQAPALPQGQMPDYSKFISQPAKQAAGQEKGVTEQRQYIGPNGEMITIMFIDGVPQQEVPKDYKVYKPEEVKPPAVVAPKVVQQGGDGGDGPEDPGKTAIDIGRALTGKVDDPALQKAQDELANFGLKSFGIAAAAVLAGVPTVAFGAIKGREQEYNNLRNAYFKEVARVATAQNPDKYKADGLYSRLTNPTTKVLDVAKEGTPVGFTDETRNTYVDQDGLVRDTSGLSSETKSGLEIASTTGTSYDQLGRDETKSGGVDSTGKRGATSGYDPTMAEDYGDQSGGNDNSSNDTGMSESSGTADDVANEGGLE